jgi:hypothetical protein
MSTKLGKLLLSLAICASLLISLSDAVNAKSVPLSAISIRDAMQKTIGFVPGPDVVPWDILGWGEIQLTGPYDSEYLSFRLPADWKLISGTELNLSLGVFVSTGIQNPSTPVAAGQDQPYSTGIIGGGTLRLDINGSTLIILPLDQVGEVEKTIQIPLEAFISNSDDGSMNVAIILETSETCNNYYQMNVVIHNSSFFTLPHDSIPPSTTLLNFPGPIYQDSFIPDSALLIIPDQPLAADLQAALTVASGLGKLSNANLVMDMVTLSKLTTEQKTANHLIYIGNSASLPALGQLGLPIPVGGGQFQVPGGSLDDGIVEMVNSPWNKSKVILVVSGNTDQGTIKAAQAVSTGVFRPSKFPNLAIVQEVQTIPVSIPQPADQTLTSLGYEGQVFYRRGIGNVSYNFYVPPGWTVTSDANFELAFGHSALIDYSSSGIVVLLNDIPIGSVRMSDASANLSINKILINIPASAVIPGTNRLDVRVNLVPHDDCSPINMRGLWINIWPESALHIPLELAPINPASNLSLASYPAPFIYYPLLDNTTFVLMRNDLESWRAALQIAVFLGSTANGPVSALTVHYGDDLPEVERSKSNLLIIGRPSQLPIMDGINKTLPVPFLDGSDVLTEGNFQVTYRIPSDSPMGYMEIVSSPWNSDNVLLAVLGNTTQGLSWATSSLIDPVLRSRLAGNFAVINDKQIITSDTRLSPIVKTGSTQVPEVVVLPPNLETVPPTLQQTVWVFPVFVLSLVLIVIILAFIIIGSWSRNRTRNKQKRGSRYFGNQGYFRLIMNRISTFLKGLQNRRKDS